MSQETQSTTSNIHPPKFHVSLIAGAAAGLTVDMALYPLDTLKTRMQSAEGFLKSGGFKGVYNGLKSVAVGSAPGSALFFVSYNSTRRYLQSHSPLGDSALTNLLAATCGETAACLARVPTDNVKMRMQTGRHGTVRGALAEVMRGPQLHQQPNVTLSSSTKPSGMINAAKGLYKGYLSTLFRDVPFAMIQFPLYEAMRAKALGFLNDTNVSSPPKTSLQPAASALCGAIAGGIAAFLTCPLDLVKTRYQLGADINGKDYTSIPNTFKRVFAEGSAMTPEKPWKGGVRIMFAGAAPRVTWISIGGCVFFGAFETARKLIESFEVNVFKS